MPSDLEKIGVMAVELHMAELRHRQALHDGGGVQAAREEYRRLKDILSAAIYALPEDNFKRIVMQSISPPSP